MGHGASAGIQAATNASSVDSLREALSEVASVDRAKIEAALDDVIRSRSAPGRRKVKAPTLTKDAENRPTQPLPAAIVDALTEKFRLFDLCERGFVVVEESVLCYRILAHAQNTRFDEERVRRKFADMDKTGTGKVSLQDWMDYYSDAYGVTLSSQEEADKEISKIETSIRNLNANTKLTPLTMTALHDMFRVYDVDDSGFITWDEDKQLSEAMGVPYDESSWAHFREGDANGDDKVSLSEFVNYFKATLLEVVYADGTGFDKVEEVVKQMREDVRQALSKQTAEKT